MTELSQKEYADARGVSAAYVTKLKKAGRLVLTPGGKVNLEATDRLVEATRDPSRGGDRRPAPAGASEFPAGAPQSRDPAGGTDIAYRDAMHRERIAKARLAELELAEAAGQLVRRDQVERVLFGLARQAQDAMLALSERLAGPLSTETDPFRIAALIDTEVRAIAQTMADAKITDADDAATIEPAYA